MRQTIGRVGGCLHLCRGGISSTGLRTTHERVCSPTPRTSKGFADRAGHAGEQRKLRAPVQHGCLLQAGAAVQTAAVSSVPSPARAARGRGDVVRRSGALCRRGHRGGRGRDRRRAWRRRARPLRACGARGAALRGRCGARRGRRRRGGRVRSAPRTCSQQAPWQRGGQQNCKESSGGTRPIQQLMHCYVHGARACTAWQKCGACAPATV